MKSKIVGTVEHDDQHASDPTDRAGAEVDLCNREAQYQHQLALRANGDMPEPNADGTCVEEDCGLPVEDGRVALGLARCLSCAREHERKRQRRMRGFGLMSWAPPLKRLKSGKAVLPGAYLLVFRCRACGEEFHKAKQRGAVMHAVMQMTWREVLLVHTLHPSLQTATHMHDDGRHGLADLMALKPYRGPPIYIEDVT